MTPVHWDKFSLCYTQDGQPLELDCGDLVEFLLGKDIYTGRIETTLETVFHYRRKRLKKSYSIRFDSEYAVGCLVGLSEINGLSKLTS